MGVQQCRGKATVIVCISFLLVFMHLFYVYVYVLHFLCTGELEELYPCVFMCYIMGYTYFVKI